MYMQIDLRKSSITKERLSQLKNSAEAMGALKYVECSSVTGEGVNAVFKEAVVAALNCKSKVQ